MRTTTHSLFLPRLIKSAEIEVLEEDLPAKPLPEVSKFLHGKPATKWDTYKVIPAELKKEVYGDNLDLEVAKAQRYSDSKGMALDHSRLFEPLSVFDTDKAQFAERYPNPGVASGRPKGSVSTPLSQENLDNLNKRLRNTKHPPNSNLFRGGSLNPETYEPLSALDLLKHEIDHVYGLPEEGDIQERKDQGSIAQQKAQSQLYHDALVTYWQWNPTDPYNTYFGPGNIFKFESDPAMARIQEHMYKTRGSRFESPEEYHKWVRQFNLIPLQDTEGLESKLEGYPSDIKRFLRDRHKTRRIDLEQMRRAREAGEPIPRPKYRYMDQYYGERIPGYVQNPFTRSPYS